MVCILHFGNFDRLKESHVTLVARCFLTCNFGLSWIERGQRRNRINFCFSSTFRLGV